VCGRFGLSRDPRELVAELAEVDPAIRLPEVRPRYNIAPTQPVLVIQSRQGRLEARELRWGISLPMTREGARRDLINVRAETALGVGWFRDLLDRSRVLIPASHFYEWRSTSSRRRQPMLIGPAAGGGLVFAALLATWTDPTSGEISPAVAILTTDTTGAMAEIHRRVPVILPPSGWRRWLDPSAGAADVAELLGPCPDGWLTARPVSALVNDASNEGPELIEAAPTRPEEPDQLRLWP
jgi:putative SOS response-associated peptidase YedK